LAHEFVSCSCTKGEVALHQGCCVTPNTNVMTIGATWATPLTGFVAGAAVASIMLIPWMLILGRLAAWPHI